MRSRSRWTTTSHSSITPRSASYDAPVSTWRVARASRSRLRTFWDLANVHAHTCEAPPSPVARTTYQRGMRCGHPRRPFVAQITVRSSPRNASTSSSDILIWSRRLMGANPTRSAELRDRLAHGLARVVRLEHGRVARLGEHAAHEPVGALERDRDDDRAVGELLGHRLVLARPAGALRRVPDARDPRRRHLAGARPPLDVAERVDLAARLERVVEQRGVLDAVEAEVAQAVLVDVDRGDVPALAPVEERVRLDRPRRQLVFVGLVVLHAQPPPAGDRLVDEARERRG